MVLFYNTVLLCVRPDGVVLQYYSSVCQTYVLFYNIVLLCVRPDGTSRKQTASHAAGEPAEGGRRYAVQNIAFQFEFMNTFFVLYLPILC
jgi:hypothetical protein